MLKHPERHDRWTTITAAENREGRVMASSQQPLFFTPNMHNLWLGDLYRGATAFLVCGGPSARDHLSKLEGIPGVITMAINNAAQDFVPDLWIGLDEPKRFLNKIWLNPRIMKFTPLAYSEEPLRTGVALTPRTCANTVFIRRNDHFNAGRWLDEDTINWGLDSDGTFAGGRSTMVAALRVLFALGCFEVYLVGADFHMKEGDGAYTHAQAASEAAARRNNNLFHYLNATLFPQIEPLLRRRGMAVHNAVVSGFESKLTAFPTVSFEETVETLTAAWEYGDETSAGLYDGHFTEDQAKATPTPKPESKPPYPVNPDDISELDRIDAWRWGLTLEQIKDFWSTYMHGSSNPEIRHTMRDTAYCAAGIEPLHGLFSPPQDTKVVSSYPRGYSILAGKSVAIVGTSPAKPGVERNPDDPDDSDIVLRCGHFAIDSTTLGTRTDIWFVDPSVKGFVESIGVMKSKINNPAAVVVVLFPPLNHPLRQRDFAIGRYHLEAAGLLTIPFQGVGAELEAEATRWAGEVALCQSLTFFNVREFDTEEEVTAQEVKREPPEIETTTDDGGVTETSRPGMM